MRRPSLSREQRKHRAGPFLLLCCISKSSFNSAKSLKRDTRSLLTLFACAILRSCSSGKSAPCRTTSTPTPPTRPTTCSKYSISLFLVHGRRGLDARVAASVPPPPSTIAPGLVPNFLLLFCYLLFLHLSPGPVVASPAGRQTKCCITVCLLLIPAITWPAVLCLAQRRPSSPSPRFPPPPAPRLEGAFSYTIPCIVACHAMMTPLPRQRAC